MYRECEQVNQCNIWK